MKTTIKHEIYKEDALFQIISECAEIKEKIRLYNTLRRYQIDTVEKLRNTSLQDIYKIEEIGNKRLNVIIQIKKVIG